MTGDDFSLILRLFLIEGALANKFLYAGGPPNNNFLFAGGPPENNLFLKLKFIHSLMVLHLDI